MLQDLLPTANASGVSALGKTFLTPETLTDLVNNVFGQYQIELEAVTYTLCHQLSTGGVLQQEVTYTDLDESTTDDPDDVVPVCSANFSVSE